MKISTIGWCVPLGISGDSIARWKYRFSAPLRWWKVSSIRAVAREIGRLPHRILAILEDSNLRHGHLPIVGHPQDEDWFPWNPKDMYLDESTRDIEELLKAAPWAGDLDWALAAKAYQLGGSRFCRRDIEKRNEEPCP